MAQQATFLKPPPGEGLLPPDFGSHRSELEDIVGAAYAAVYANSAENYKHWLKVRRIVIPAIRAKYEAVGLTAPALFWDALWARVDLPVPSSDGVAHTRLVAALLTDYAPRLFQHIQDRLGSEGNVHVAIRGWTGGAKSSCALTIMDWILPLERGTVRGHLSIHLHELPRVLGRLPSGDTALQDEVLASAGDGSRTARMVFENLEDTMRKSGRNLIVISPRSQEHGTMQVELEVIAWCPPRKWSLFLAWVDGVPMGVVAIPWCAAWIYEEYLPWKDENVANTLRAEWGDKGFLAKLAERIFSDKRFVDYMMLATNKPKPKDFVRAIHFFYGGLLTKTQTDSLAVFMHQTCYEFERQAPYWKDWFGIQPNDGMKTLAAKCEEA